MVRNTAELSHLCPRCFSDRALQARIREYRKASDITDDCSIHENTPGIAFDAVVDMIDSVFRENYSVSGNYDSHEDIYTGEGMNEVVGLLTGAVDDTVTEAICQALIDADAYNENEYFDGRFFSEDWAYERSYNGNVEQSYKWAEFRRRIQFGERFFNAEAKALLSGIFEKVHLLLDVYRRSPVVTLRAKETLLYRARIITGEAEEATIIGSPADQLGPPPDTLRRQGRMNAAGILAFYGAFDKSTCIAELRPPVGSRIALAAFRPTRSLVLLDMSRFQAPPKDRNVFSVSYRDRMSQWLFMQRFMQEISSPVLPGDEVFEYIPTQVVAEYLVNHHNFGRGATHKSIDGLIYPSAQQQSLHNGMRACNIVLFGEAAMVEGTAATKTRSDGGAVYRYAEERTDAPKPGLRYRMGSLSIRKVVGVEITVGSVVDDNDPDEPEPHYQ